MGIVTPYKVFVFGSNEAGRHGAGAALYALQRYGAVPGQGFGLMGLINQNSYKLCFGIPTKDKNLKRLSLNQIEKYVKEFLNFAENNLEKDLLFYVTRIGCGYSKYTDKEIAPMFINAPTNCEFDPSWSKWGLKSWSERM